MNLRTFQAATMADALDQVKRSLGVEAVILHTRMIHKPRWLGLRRTELVEITAGDGIQIIPRQTRRNSVPDAYRRQIKPAPLQEQRRDVQTHKPFVPPLSLPERGRQILNTPNGQTAMMSVVAEEMGCLKQMVKELVHQTRSQGAPSVPEDLFEHYKQLIESQVAEDLAHDIIKALQKELRPEHMGQADFVRQKLADHLEKLIPAAGPIHRTKLIGAHVVALIGPTGVGKTTTIAKLAAHLKLRERHKVGLITIDTYRIAAVDQLRKYAEILGSPLRTAATAEDLRAAIDSMQDMEFILIDTAGRSPNDAMKLNELKSFLTAAAPDEVHLVLSTTASQACVESAIKSFGDIRADRIIFTKLDEAVHLGVMLNVARKLNKGLSYITVGQDVPDDIEVGHARRLAKWILGEQL
jgi:flagellar biosynthesis protein FlhF